MAISLSVETVRKRIAVIDYDLCNPDKCGNYLCERVCPVNRAGKDCITHEPGQKPVISEELCTGCMICVKKCPFGAISIINLDAELGEEWHRFGQNGFRVFRSMSPLEDNIVGFIGPNGTGKSTVLSILAGLLVPNLGDYEHASEKKKVEEHFRGRELYEYFTALYAGNKKAAYKPQHVEEIPKKFAGKVKDLLQKVDERGMTAEYAKRMHVDHLLDHDLGKLSGGELQRVAILATIVKKADVYLLDEPSSYLDIRERLNLASVLRDACAGKAVVVIEHDLALLDYVSDYVHILFGEPGTYGCVTQRKSVRLGINEFLDGFLRDENLRFRSQSLNFNVRPSDLAAKHQTPLLFSLPESRKTQGSFTLDIAKMDFHQGSVIGIMGPNGTGKTTFVKMIAGLDAPDTHPDGFGLGLRVSYKPQQLPRDSTDTVMEHLLSLPNPNPEVLADVKKRLQLDRLMEKPISQLSGGELQRVAIAYCLGQDADLYVLDEPSAFLDVEQRLASAAVIRSAMEKQRKTALIVDHDVLFADSISDELMVFSGQPGVKANVSAPDEKPIGMNRFLKDLGVTFRRDEETGRPRLNKPGSVKDQEQKRSGNYYYDLGA